MAREMLKLRKGDSAICIKSDGKVELAGVNDKPLMNEEGMISPVILFAAAWAKKDQKVIKTLVENFKNCVREGYFGPDAQSDFKTMEVEAEKERLKKERGEASGAVTMQSAASGAVTRQQPVIEPTVTKEEWDKGKEEEARLNAIVAQGQDPRVKRQMEAMKAGAKTVKTEPFTKHHLPDLPVEQTMAYQKASPEEQKKMKEEEQKKKAASGTVTTEQVVGTATIEEGVDNEDK